MPPTLAYITGRARAVVVIAAVVVGVVVVACAEGPAPEPPEVARATCDAPVGGVPLSPAVLEAAPGYDAELAARDLEGLPATLSLDGVDLPTRALVGYALELRLDELGLALDTATVRARGPMGDAVAASFASGALDVEFLRRGVHRFYACDRALPLTLDGFESLYGEIDALPAQDIPLSIPKQAPRRLREDRERHVYVAESLEDGGVRETEILVGDARRDGALDFLVYDASGALMDRSRFATVLGGTTVSASPYACMTCHVDFEAQTYDVISPTDVGGE